MRRFCKPSEILGETKYPERVTHGALLEPVCLKNSAAKTTAPRVYQFENQGFVEVGTWQIRKLRQRPTIEFYPWKAPESTPQGTPEGRRVNRDPLALAHFYQSLLDNGIAQTRAELARYLGVSRARVTQVLRRLKKASRHQDEGEA